MTARQHRISTTATATATVLLFGAVLATPAAARQDAGPAADQERTSTSCPLTRVGTQLVRCDNLTGNGVNAPLWITQR